MIVVHGLKLSGHVHRVELMLSLLGLPYDFRPVTAATLASPAFRALNPLGQVPVVEDGSVVLADSNAILVYLVRHYAPGSDWIPRAPEAEAAVQRWLSLAAGELVRGPATARVAHVFGRSVDLPAAHAVAATLLTFMERHLAERTFLASQHPTIADIANYSYVAHAPEGGVSLEPYRAVQAWLARIEALPHFFPMPASALPGAVA